MSSTISTAAPVKTSKVVGRRIVRFATLDDIQADAERLAAGPVRQLGNWSVRASRRSFGAHQKMSLDGDPARAPWPIRMFCPGD